MGFEPTIFSVTGRQGRPTPLQDQILKYQRWDSNPHVLRTLAFETSASTNSATLAFAVVEGFEPPPPAGNPGISAYCYRHNSREDFPLFETIQPSVPREGLEPSHLTTSAPQTELYTIPTSRQMFLITLSSH
jgi:hypothetical protein